MCYKTDSVTDRSATMDVSFSINGFVGSQEKHPYLFHVETYKNAFQEDAACVTCSADTTNTDDVSGTDDVSMSISQ